ncbi:MAG: hypothetical protein RL681_806 [Candidatus Parcubacteria bacterium]
MSRSDIRVEQVVAELKKEKMAFARNGEVVISAPHGFSAGDLKKLQDRLKVVGIKARAKLTRPPVIVIKDVKTKSR